MLRSRIYRLPASSAWNLSATSVVADSSLLTVSPLLMSNILFGSTQGKRTSKSSSRGSASSSSSSTRDQQQQQQSQTNPAMMNPAGGQSSSDQQTAPGLRSHTFFVSQQDKVFFTESAFSVIKKIKNTLVVPSTDGLHHGSTTSSDSSGGGGKKMLKHSRKVPDLKIATEGRPLRFHSDSSSPYEALTHAAIADARKPPLPPNFAKRKWWYAMMPAGYPHSVSPGYGRFFVCNIVGCALAAFSLTLATQALLSSFFAQGTSVGWMVKDILPAFVTAYLAHRFINVEKYPREWFIVANVLTQSAVCFDLGIPHIAAAVGGNLLVPLAALSSFVKGLAMLILTTSRTALVQSFSREGNLVDLSKRLHGSLILVYPLASAVALSTSYFFGTSTLTMMGLVGVSSVCCIGVAVAMVHPIYSRLLKRELAVENCRRFLNQLPLIKPHESPTAALFRRKAFNVPFMVGMNLSREVIRARRRKETLVVISLHSSLQRAKYLFVFRKPKSLNKSEGNEQQHQQQQKDVDYEDDASASSVIMTPKRFVGVVYDVNATFSDVIEGIYAALMFTEPPNPASMPTSPSATTGSTSCAAQEKEEEQDEIRFLKRPNHHDVVTFVQQLVGASWQVRAHQVDDRDLRIQILATSWTAGDRESVATTADRHYYHHGVSLHHHHHHHPHPPGAASGVGGVGGNKVVVSSSSSADGGSSGTKKLLLHSRQRSPETQERIERHLLERRRAAEKKAALALRSGTGAKKMKKKIMSIASSKKRKMAKKKISKTTK